MILPLVIGVLYFMQTAVVLLAVGIPQGAGKANHSLASRIPGPHRVLREGQHNYLTLTFVRKYSRRNRMQLRLLPDPRKLRQRSSLSSTLQFSRTRASLSDQFHEFI